MARVNTEAYERRIQRGVNSMNMTMTNSRQQFYYDEGEWETVYATDLPMTMPYSKAQGIVKKVLENNEIPYTTIAMEKNGITRL